MSACETGVGEVKNGEGVFGLRRAFFLAGAETLVMSLWEVSDNATREIMTSYYSGLKNGLERATALREAQLTILKRGPAASVLLGRLHSVRRLAYPRRQIACSSSTAPATTTSERLSCDAGIFLMRESPRDYTSIVCTSTSSQGAARRTTAAGAVGRWETNDARKTTRPEIRSRSLSIVRYRSHAR